MPEIFEAGYFFACYIWFFILLVTIVHGPEALNVLGLWCDLSTGESTLSKEREIALLDYAKTLDKCALARGHLARWVNDLQDLAEAIPDTHGLMIHYVWQGLHPPIRRQISPNYLTWKSFCDALRALEYGVESIPEQRLFILNIFNTPTHNLQFTVPLPWHRHALAPHIPYQIGDTPSQSGLVVKLTRQMPELFRGRDPDPDHHKKKSKGRAVSPILDIQDISDSEDDDIDTAVVLERDSGFDVEDESNNSQSQAQCEPPTHSAQTDRTRYFWPRYALPVLADRAYSAADAIQSAGMRLVGLLFDARKTILNLETAFVEFEPLLHTSPQIYTRRQWNGVKQVPRGHRGFKIGYAIEFVTHTLCWNTFDNNFRLHWRTPSEEASKYVASHVPDWCCYTAQWLRQMFTKNLKQTTLLEALCAPGCQPFRGLGRYGANEVLSIAELTGIPGWVLLGTILQDKVLFSIICEAFFEFVSTRGLQAEDYVRRSQTTIKLAPIMEDDPDVDCTMNASLAGQLEYVETLRTHGRKRTYVSPVEAALIDSYNEASLNTWDESFKSQASSSKQNLFSHARQTDMSKVLFPFDMGNVRSSVTKFGHLGPIIAGDFWPTILEELGASPTILSKLEKDFRKLPKVIPEAQLLALKPQHLLEPYEREALPALMGEENPIATYFKQPRFSKKPYTHLVKMETRTGFIWTTLIPPFISLATRMRSRKNADAKFKPLDTVQGEHIRDEYTIDYIKNHTKGWTVGPYDFVGHGRTGHYGGSSFVGLCFWHPDLSAGEMLALQASWDARSRYPVGMRKLAKDQIEPEKTWRSKVKSSRLKEMGGAAAAAASADYFVREIIRHRRFERAEIREKILKLTKDDRKGKARGSGGPASTARVCLLAVPPLSDPRAARTKSVQPAGGVRLQGERARCKAAGACTVQHIVSVHGALALPGRGTIKIMFLALCARALRWNGNGSGEGEGRGIGRAEAAARDLRGGMDVMGQLAEFEATEILTLTWGLPGCIGGASVDLEVEVPFLLLRLYLNLHGR
ncbi:hypothetical protein B0H15DRAFT_807095 [Mycena belliarum]|uniref:Uncharacterized protein n=1 Tax=Mycena belliarum TaxID=1033014 RepID=A0AAD6TMA7_9AGAR|nr:hypothetical protein B0H15DRAFT_807095 [Mycena belliae]